ncbi:hypothetical protein ACYJ1Y_05920 [Natrialbaceae archaeon A-gly3]
MARASGAVRRTGIFLGVVLAVLVTVVGVATAANVALGLSENSGDVTVPTWLYLATGGGVIGASALLTMLVTDRETISTFHDGSVEAPLGRLYRAGSLLLGTIGILGLAFVLLVGVFGPQIGSLSAAVLLVFAGVRGMLTMFVYLVGNPWRAINPWRRIATALPNGYLEYPEWLGTWPAVGALLVLIWLEIVAPLATLPWTLVLVVTGYSAFTIAGAVAFTPETWFRRGDPISVLFRLYGAVGPIQRTDEGLEIRPPGSRLSDDDVVVDLSSVAFILLLVWELTYSGFIVTSPGVRTVEFLVGVGVPPAVVYLTLLIAGFALFCGVYWYAAGHTRNRAETYISQRYLAIRFAPPLLAIAAGYHVAHYIGFSVSLWPSLLQTMVSPFSPPPNPTQFALASWFGYLEIAAILLGHILAVWIAHTVSFELFPGKLQAIRSQYPFIVVMILFTMASLYLVSLPGMEPVYVPG